MRLISLTSAVWLCLGLLALGQQPPVSLGSSGTGAGQLTLQGRVLDSTRAAIAGARIAAVPEGRPSSASTLSESNGEFSLTLEPGVYTLTIIAEGFQEASQPLRLAETSAQFQEVILQVAPRRDTIVVTETVDYQTVAILSATKTQTPLRDVPQSVTVVTRELIRDQSMQSIGDVVRYVPGLNTNPGEGNRDAVIIRGNNSTADFFVNGLRDDVQYYRDLYNLEQVEALKGPNALIFGRGGAGGVINRVTKEAGFTPFSEITLQGGTHGNKRFSTDFDRPLGDKLAFRFNGLYENAESFRDHVGLERYGISPALTIEPGARTKVNLSYEYFHDNRLADRGIPSFQGKPDDIGISTFFGNPDESDARADVNLGLVSVDHQMGGLNIRNRTLIGDYDKFYQNFVPGAVTADRSQVALSAYNNTTVRRNVFNQTDLIYTVSTGPIRHALLTGVEVGRQMTGNFRNTGYFNNSATSISVAHADPVISTPMTFRQNATDADNHIRTNLAAVYLQDQVSLTRHVQLVAGVRFDYFDLNFEDNRTGAELRRIDHLVSPRAGIVLKPVGPLSVYGSYSVSYLPSSGDQFSSLTTITQQVKPERFNNYEAGVKWNISRYLLLTIAAYRMDRINTRATDPNDPTRILQTGSQRTNGFEIGINGSITPDWQIAGGYAYQDAFISSATTAARAGALVAQVPHHSFSLWNNYRIMPRVGVGLGILHQTEMYAGVDNTVILPGYVRADGAVFFSLTERVRLQANIENLFDRRYYANAHSNSNIYPGSSRALRLGLTARF